MIRLFAAVAAPEPALALLMAAQKGLIGARWRPPESLHLTLRFFGAVSEDRADDLDAELGAVGGRAFDLALSGVGLFEDAAGPRAVWAGVAASPALEHLAQRCERAARRAGLPAETRAFRPHLTLAYLKGAEPTAVAAWVQAHNLLRTEPLAVSAFGLFSSWKGEAGSHYRLERRYALV